GKHGPGWLAMRPNFNPTRVESGRRVLRENRKAEPVTTKAEGRRGYDSDFNHFI
ncbi:hypothetical protein TNCV_2802871, partial [Trichonephila clavipes]